MAEAITISKEAVETIREAVLDGERLLAYPELAERLNISVDTARGLVAARIIRPSIKRGNVVRFHWPSVVDQMRRN